MAYSINGKVYTDHPLMDEIVHSCKQIMNSIVVKNDELANYYEDEKYIDEVEYFMMTKDGSISFDIFPFTTNILMSFGYDIPHTRSMMEDINNVPEEDREELLEFACDYFLSHYEEKNLYYRMLSGLPPYGTKDFDVYIDRSYFPSNYIRDIDLSKPLHELDRSAIAVLTSTGKIEQLLSKYRGSNYAYLRYLGDNSIDIYTARKAKKYDILKIGVSESLVVERFRELYEINKEVYLKRTYSEAYAYDSDYYEQFMILLILAQTFTDMIVDVAEWYIRRDIFDIRSVEYFLDSYGVKFYKEIPLKYQIRIVKNLNKLIKYKSSNKNFADILEIFQLDDTAIYKYYLYKKRKKTISGNYSDGDSESDKYELEFVQAKLNESYDDYIKDMIYRTPYDDITYQDKYWDGENDHALVRENHLNRDFTIEGTKYMSLEYKVSISEYNFQMKYLMGLILDSDVDMDDIQVSISAIQPSVNFRLTDLFIFLFLLSLGFDDCSTEIFKPSNDGKIDKPSFEKYTDFDGGYSYTMEYEYDETASIRPSKSGYEYLLADGGSSVEYSEIRSVEYFYDWMKKQYPEFFIKTDDRVYGFNNKVDMEKIEEIIGRRHSKFQFDKGFSLSDFGLDKFIITDKITSFDQISKVYYNNKECYEKLEKMMTNEYNNRDDYEVMKFLYDSFFTKEFDYDYYKINNGKEDAKYLEQVLQDRDYVLYSTYNKIMLEKNMETRKDSIRAIIDNILSVLEYYLGGDGMEYLFSFIATNSFDALIRYMLLMINFFKSYKVYFLDPFVTYVADDRVENFSGALDTLAEKRIIYERWDRGFQRDNFDYDTYHILEERYTENQVYELLDVYGHFEADPDDDYDYDGMYADTENSGLEYKDADGGHAEWTSCIPYIMLNGGNAQLGNLDIWNLDGATAYEMNEYVDVDGGYPFDVDDLRKDYYGTAFTYVLDGGSAGTNQFITRTMRTRVIDRQIESDVRISKAVGNRLKIKDDGLYFTESFIEWDDWDNIIKDYDETYERYLSSYNNLIEYIEIINNNSSDEFNGVVADRINSSINHQLLGARKVMEYMDNDSFEKALREYVDNGVNDIYRKFYGFEMFSWGTFD